MTRTFVELPLFRSKWEKLGLTDLDCAREPTEAGVNDQSEQAAHANGARNRDEAVTRALGNPFASAESPLFTIRELSEYPLSACYYFTSSV